jgi:high-affinity nickel permease
MKKIILVTIFSIFNISLSIAQCAMCRASVGSNLSEGKGVIGASINDGILYLLSVPYIVVGAGIYLWYRSAMKNRMAQQA